MRRGIGMIFRQSMVAGALAALALAPLAVQAAQQMYRCVGTDGKKYYEQVIPPQCTGQRIDILNSQGQVVRRIDRQADEKQRAAQAAAAAKKKEDDKAAREERRRNNALLATYTSEKDIEDARARAVADNTKAVKLIQGRIAAIKKRQAGYAKEMEFYKQGAPAKAKGAAAAPKPPQKLADDVRAAEIDLDAQEQLLASKHKEVEGINAKYDEDKKRYLELTAPRK